MRPQLRTSTEQRRRSSSSISPDPGLLHDPRQRRTSAVSVGSSGSGSGSAHNLIVPGPPSAIRRTSLCLSSSAFFSASGSTAPDGPRKRSSVTSAGSGMLRVPKSQDHEPRRRSLPGYMDGVGGKSQHSPQHLPQYCRLVPPSHHRRRSSVRPEEEYRQINEAGTKKMKIFGLVLIAFLALVIGVSFLKLFH